MRPRPGMTMRHTLHELVEMKRFARPCHPDHGSHLAQLTACVVGDLVGDGLSLHTTRSSRAHPTSLQALQVGWMGSTCQLSGFLISSILIETRSNRPRTDFCASGSVLPQPCGLACCCQWQCRGYRNRCKACRTNRLGSAMPQTGCSPSKADSRRPGRILRSLAVEGSSISCGPSWSTWRRSGHCCYQPGIAGELAGTAQALVAPV